MALARNLFFRARRMPLCQTTCLSLPDLDRRRLCVPGMRSATDRAKAKLPRINPPRSSGVHRYGKRSRAEPEIQRLAPVDPHDEAAL